MRVMFLLGLIFLLAACERPDDFIYATKLVYTPDTIVVNEPFTMKVVLRNDSLKDMKFTLDKNICKSVDFFLSTYCDSAYVRDDLSAWQDVKHEYEVFHLKKDDSLAYNVIACLKSKGDSLIFQVEDHYRVTRFARPTCRMLIMNIYGQWRPGTPYFLDSDEGYGFVLENIAVIEKDITQKQRS